MRGFVESGATIFFRSGKRGMRTAIVLAMIGFAGTALGGEVITDQGTTWTAATWGYTSPKLLWDGKRAYAINLIGKGPGEDVAKVYWRDDQGWHEGATISPVYQPATILLDEQGRVNVFCTKLGERGYHWRGTTAGQVKNFEPVELNAPETFAFGYLGVGRSGNITALVGLDKSYRMWIEIKKGDEPWSAPVLLADSQTVTLPKMSPVYPIVWPDENGVDVVYSSSPDGGVHNTYNRVEWARFDLKTNHVIKRQVVSQGPVGEMTYGLDAVRLPDGRMAVLLMQGLYVYGTGTDIEQRRGLWVATQSEGNWNYSRVTESTGTAQLWIGADKLWHVYESSSSGARDHVSSDGGKTWKLQAEKLWEAGGFLYVMKANSGSVMDGVLRAVQAEPRTKTTENPAIYRLRYIERLGE
jgi:hypothetical protein